MPSTTSLIAMALFHFSSLMKCSSLTPAFTSAFINLCRTTAIQHQFHQPTASYNKMYPGGSATRLLFSLHPSQMRYHQTSLKSTNDAEEEPAKKKQKSRKQRMRIAKQFPMQRIDKVLADRGLGTRSKTFELAKSGRIATASHENVPFEERTVIRGPSEKVRSNAIIFIDGKLIPGPTPLLMAYHKPKWMLSVMEDDKKYQDQERRHLGQVLAPRYVRSGMHPVGRLDYDTSGLILFSSDGKLTNKLLHPKQGIEKEYVATVKGEVDMEELKHKLAEGVETTEGVHTAILLEVLPSEGPSDEEDPRKRPEGNEDGEDEFIEKADDYDGPYSDVRLIVSEGKYRMVRRMLHNCGHSVVELRRERHGAVRLDLKVGEFREASEDELEWANKLL